ncbi:phosphatidate cytidylyltransferase [Pyrobaculum neutrophilum]|uniref:Phosphatidate cytidylyltransferase n=1 Tax=Pyrobaculum neutrophilum (strain DSM 2338 / JCM 9278 / NBRC 100436 / V24Sta) TaxID=444157 RepID=B1YBP3_PYRNV|nr:phosphatidate cytidylyltransferase [Pyrobaculum neutrophilum]ACB40845.1 phosphatidate cytidylyltransferase [Pyrobaculum neutrophilum V24Sta]
MSKIQELKALLARKLFHVVFVALVAVPLFVQIPPEPYIALLALASGVLYSLQIKEPYAWEELRQNFFKTLEELFARLEALLPLDKPELKTQYQNALRQLELLISMAERDYERRHGYLGILMGSLGFLIATAAFGPRHLPAAVVSMAVYDAVSAVAGTIFGGRRIFGKLTTWGTLLGYLANTAALVAVGMPLLHALAVTAMVVAADALSHEDNLTIPVAAAGGSYLLSLL